MILIRTDANEKVGVGHLMRCLSIARAFMEKGRTVLFVTADHKSDSLINGAGLKSICLNTEWDKMDDELSIITNIIQFKQPSLFLVDSYYVTENYFHTVRKLAKTVYIDDLNESIWDVHYVINYNVYGPAMDYSCYDHTDTKLILGPLYAPLRNEFKCLPKRIINIDVTDVMVSAGGADPEAITEKMISSICSSWEDITFHFIVGALNPRLELIIKLAEKKDNVLIHINETNMVNLMTSCDLAISAAGSTLYELCACGTPTITYTLADNQVHAIEQFKSQGIMLRAGDCRNNESFIEQVEKCLQQMICDLPLREEQSAKMQSLVDGNGAQRIVEILLEA